MESLNPAQTMAVNHERGPLLIVAGAGSGKTRTLTSRLLELGERGVPLGNIVAITFTNKAAREMMYRLETRLATMKDAARAVPFIGTFHSFGARILRKEAAFFGRTPSFSIFDDDDTLSLLKIILRGFAVPRTAINPRAIAREISRVKNEAEGSEPANPLHKEVWRSYEQALRENNAFDFDDLIEKVVRVFRENPAILARYRKRFRHILVDEFQDVNHAQYALVKLLAAEHRNLSVVGDDAQSIYGFRGSDFRTFLDFERDWPDATVVLLEENYRSTANIVAAASAVIARNKLQKRKALWTKNPPGEPIRVGAAATEDEEAEWIAEEVAALREEGPEATTAILYRTNAQSRPLEQALILQHIPYRIFGGITFYARKEIKDIVAAIRAAANPDDAVSRERLLKLLPRRTGAAFIATLPDAGHRLSPFEFIKVFLAQTDYLERLDREFDNAEERRENINELLAFAGTFTSLPDFLERISLFEATDAPAKTAEEKGGGAPVHLMSIHLAKGLEFRRVFVAGCSEGLLPHHRSLASFEELEEERRLMYVAMTRAREKLTLSFSNLASRFLYEVPPELAVFVPIGGRKEPLSAEDEIYIE